MGTGAFELRRRESPGLKSLSFHRPRNKIKLGRPFREGFESDSKISKSLAALPFAQTKPTSMAASKYTQKLRTIAAAWPTDPFRPNVQLKVFLESLSTHPRLSPEAVRSARVLSEDGVQHKVSPSLVVSFLEMNVRSTLCLKRPWSRRRCPNTMNVWSKGTRGAQRVSDGRGGKCFSVFGDDPELFCTPTFAVKPSSGSVCFG